MARRKKQIKLSYQLKRARRAVEQDINEKMLRFGPEASEDIGNLMVEYCRNLLRTRANPAPQSKGIINKIAESIHLEDVKGRAVFSSTKNNKKILGGKILKVPIDKDRLVMFLEYGTGLVSDDEKHPEAGSINWRYAVNDGKPKTIMRKLKRGNSFIKYPVNIDWYTQKFNRRGFVFKYKGNEYIDRNDVLFSNFYQRFRKQPKPYLSKTGKLVQPKQSFYTLYNEEAESTYVFSSGLKPIRFIYDTRKQGLPEIISQYREDFKK